MVLATERAVLAESQPSATWEGYVQQVVQTPALSSVV
jgi:hypothetical protein